VQISANKYAQLSGRSVPVQYNIQPAKYEHLGSYTIPILYKSVVERLVLLDGTS